MKKLILTTLGVCAVAFGAQAQSHSSTEEQTIAVKISEHALVAVTDVDLEFDFSSQTPTTAGAAFELGNSNSQTAYLHYSMMLSDGGTDNATISASISGLQEGLELSLLVNDIPSNGTSHNGTVGTVTSDFDATGNNGNGQGSGNANSNNVLSATAATIIDGIGTSYTGTGNTDGFKITYTLAIEDYSDLDAETLTGNVGTITYTIAE